MLAALDTSRPTTLRLLGFVCTASGGALIAFGALQTWATVGASGDRAGVLDTAIPGVDTAEGKAVLAAGVLILVGIMALRLASSGAMPTAIAAAILLLALGALGVGVADLATGHTRFADEGAKRMAEAMERTGVVPVGAGSDVVQLGSSVDLGVGLWLVVVGGGIGVLGGILDLAWVRRDRPDGGDGDPGRTGADGGGASA